MASVKPKVTPMPETVQLAELLCARLCHDLGGTIGILSGALELARRADRDDRLADAIEASDALSNRLRVLRAAWGPGGARLDAARLRELAAGLPGQDRVRLDLDALPRGTQFGPALGRMLLNLLAFAPEVLPRGGAARAARSVARPARAPAGRGDVVAAADRDGP